MAEYPRTKPRNVSERVYRALLRAYPRNFRDEFGDAMVEFHRDRLAHARLESPLLGAPRVWLHVAADLLRNALPARVDAMRRHNRKLDKEDLMLASFIQDLRYALRGIRRSPGFSFTV